MFSKRKVDGNLNRVHRGFTSAQFDAKRVAGIVARVVIIVCESQGFPATGPAIGLLEAVFLSSWFACVWAVCLVFFTILALVEYTVSLAWFDALFVVRAVLFCILLWRNQLLARNKFTNYVVDLCWRSSLLIVVGLYVSILVLIVRSFSGSATQAASRLVVAACLLYISYRCYEEYLARGGRSIRERLGGFKLRDVGVSAATVILFLLGFEAFLRIVVPQTRYQPTGIFIPHPVRLYDIAPHTLRRYSSREYSVRFMTNELGLKDYSIGPKRPDTFRVLCAGDSFTMGWGASIEEAYPKQLQKFLRNEHPEASIEVINFGSLGYSIPHILSKMRDVGFGLEPDLVIVQMYPENDIPDTLSFVGKLMQSCNVAVRRHQETFRRDMTLLARIRNFCRRHSHAFVFLYNRWDILNNRYRWFREKSKRYPVIPGRPFYLESCLKEYYPELEEAWQLTETYLAELRDECRRRGIPLIAFTVPANFEVCSTFERMLVEDAGADPEMYDLSKNWRLMNNIFDRLDIPYVDLRQPLLDTGEPERYYWKFDVHMNIEGNAFVAELLKPVVWREYCEWAGSRLQP